MEVTPGAVRSRNVSLPGSVHVKLTRDSDEKESSWVRSSVIRQPTSRMAAARIRASSRVRLFFVLNDRPPARPLIFPRRRGPVSGRRESASIRPSRRIPGLIRVRGSFASVYNAWVFIHLAGVFGFLLAHGVSVSVLFRLQKERNPERVNDLIALSGSSIRMFY